MGQKINPTGLRIGVIKDWESRWYADPKDFGDTLVEDHKLREFLLELLAPAGVPKIEIERNSKRVNINIFCAKPGMVIPSFAWNCYPTRTGSYLPYPFPCSPIRYSSCGVAWSLSCASPFSTGRICLRKPRNNIRSRHSSR